MLRAPSLPGSLRRRVAYEEAYVDAGLVEKVAGDRPAEHAGSAGNKHRCHD